MAILLNIDTATSFASVCLSNDEKVIAFKDNAIQKEHASFIHVAIGELLAEAGIRLSNVDAVAITSGPGSYTGLRVSMSTAKGICFALNKPLICVNTLQVMAQAVLEEIDNGSFKDVPFYICPMIDARRMDVFTAIYDRTLKTIMAPGAITLEAEVFAPFLAHRTVFFCGDGSIKFQNFSTHANSRFIDKQYSAVNLVPLANRAFVEERFANLAYIEPGYSKDFYPTNKNFP